VDYEHWDAHIDLYLKMLEFDDAEDMAFVKEIGEKAHYLCITPEEGGGFRVHIMINYFEELMSEEYGSYLKYETLMEDEELASMFDIPELSPEEEAVAQLIKEILDRFDNETTVDRTTAFKTAIRYLMRQNEEDALSVEKIAATLTVLLENVLEEEKDMEEQDS
jgi:sugar-specific transcriptional regulator TrmB